MTDDIDAQVVRQFRENGGRVGPPFQSRPIILVHHVGARSGTARVTPLVYITDGDAYVIVASAGAAPTHPGWFHNLTAHPRTRVEVAVADGVRTVTVDAVQATGAERDALYARMVEAMPFFGNYERTTAGVRTIPLFRLVPVG
ncbi:MAG: nitroreductase family deazaflavin-dependent oxidoreductase [Geodermatophilaceae bacterium]|nr:nitroreductase family deazaflavin-dependent oxidoreductase [Geodermatophilaceae bacterium]